MALAFNPTHPGCLMFKAAWDPFAARLAAVYAAPDPGLDRRLQLLAAACCGRLLPAMTDRRHRDAYHAALRLADGEITVAEFGRAAEPVVRLWAKVRDTFGRPGDCLTAAARHLGPDGDVANVARFAARFPAMRAGPEGSPAWGAAFAAELGVLGRLVGCVFGDVFQPATFAPAWRTPTAVGVAARIYAGHDFAAMPILADALQDAGCEEVSILDHCRGDGPHARGCWAVDGVLGR